MAPVAAETQMERTNVRLPADLVRALAELAEERGEKFAPTLRAVVRLGLLRVRELTAEGRLVA